MNEFFKGVVLSFYSSRFYFTVAHQWKGIGIGFVMLLSVVNILSLMSWNTYTEIHGIMDKIPPLASTMPYVSFRNGALSIDKPSPFYVRMPDNTIVGVIDTNYKITDVDALTQFMKNNKIVFLVTANKIAVLKDKKEEVDITDITTTKDFTITHQNWSMMGDNIAKWGVPLLLSFMFVLLFVVMVIGNFFAAFFVGIVVKIVALILRAGIDFAAAIRLAAAFRLSVQVIKMLPLIIGHPLLAGLAGWGIWLLYLLFAVWSSRQSNNSAA